MCRTLRNLDKCGYDTLVCCEPYIGYCFVGLITWLFVSVVCFMVIGLPLGVYLGNQNTALVQDNGGHVEFKITNAFLIVRNLQEVLAGDKQFMEENINVYLELYAPNVTNKITGKQETLICSKDTIDSPAVLGGKSGYFL